MNLEDDQTWDGLRAWGLSLEFEAQIFEDGDDWSRALAALLDTATGSRMGQWWNVGQKKPCLRMLAEVWEEIWGGGTQGRAEGETGVVVWEETGDQFSSIHHIIIDAHGPIKDRLSMSTVPPTVKSQPGFKVRQTVLSAEDNYSALVRVRRGSNRRTSYTVVDAKAGEEAFNPIGFLGHKTVDLTETVVSSPKGTLKGMMEKGG
ncbi:hypothetical protein B0H13DRAFT_1850075 [Mycena leptocephala]|nr:hypothetical protein B0H13DRAFT_1850075 [Mycena leptocephala]